MGRALGHDGPAVGERIPTPGSPPHARPSCTWFQEENFALWTPALRAHGAEVSKRTRFAGTGQEPFKSRKDEFAALFPCRRTSIKAALLNQKLLHGVGNIYADESLFRAGIRPRRMARHLKRAGTGPSARRLRAVLQEAISLGGSSVSDYVDAAGVAGFFQLEHRVYLRTGLPCLVCEAPDPAHGRGRPRYPLLLPLPE